MTRPVPVSRPDDSSDSDHELVDRARRGDQDGFRLIVEKYQRRMIGLVWGLVGDDGDAEDVAQEAFLRAFRSLRTFRGESSFRSWLFQIALNTARTHRQTHQRRLEDAIGGTTELDLTADPRRADDRLIARDGLRRAMATLPAELREAVVLRDVNGLDYREIAAVLAVPIGTVESRIFRGRARLRLALGPQPVPEGARR